MEVTVVNEQKNLMGSLFTVLHEHIHEWMSQALGRLFCSSLVDLPLAFGLAICLPLVISSSQLRQIVASNPRAANKIQVRFIMLNTKQDVYFFFISGYRFYDV